MVRLTLLALLACQLVAAMPGRCGHVEMQNATVSRRRLLTGNDTRHLEARSTAFSPIRIKVYWGSLTVPSSVEPKLRSAIDGAINWFEHVLKVKPISSSWKLESVSCGDFEFAGDILTDSFEADYVFYITGDSADNGLAGAATYCQQDATTGQPIAGLYYFNGLSHETASDEQILSTTIHEMTHALGFAPSLYNDYLRSDGSVYDIDEIFKTETMRGHTVLKLSLPNSLAKAKAGFGCSDLTGIELEGQGSTGTVGAHWEKRIMYNDYMVADADVYDIAYTDVTVALFKDMGWYDVDYQYSNEITWGYQRGCSFISQKCISNSQPITSDFCVDQTSEVQMCDFQHIRKGRCNLGVYSTSLPAYFAYFSDARIGGSDQYLDYCPIVKPQPNGDCRDQDTVLLQTDYGEEAGYDSRCVTGTYSKSGSTKEHAGCHKVACSGSTATVTIGSTTVQCPASGGDVEVDGYSGVVHCPSHGALCAAIPCVNNCYGLGYCKDSQCVCDDGSSSCQGSFSRAEVLAAGFTILLLAN